MKINNHNQPICIIYNYAQHYRLGIFRMIDQNIDVDFYFGDKFGDVEKLDYKALRNVTKEVANKAILPPFYWQSGVVCLFFKKYNRYLILGEYYCLSTWLLLILCKLSRKKIYIWTHGWYGNETFLKRFVKKIRLHFLKILQYLSPLVISKVYY